MAVLTGPKGGVVELVDAETGARRTVGHIVAAGGVYQMRGRYFL